MAMNWTISQATKALIEGNEEVLSIGKSYPAVLVELAKAVENESAVKLLTSMPDNATVRVVNGILTGGKDDEDVEENNDEDVEEKKVSKRGRKPSMDSDEEKKAKAKARRDARKAKAKAAAEEAEDEEDEDGDEYSEMSAMELYQLCKKRGLKPEQKKKPEYYIAMLKENDEPEEDWGEDDFEEEEEKPTPKKSSKKTSAKKEEEEDDEWDI